MLITEGGVAHEAIYSDDVGSDGTGHGAVAREFL
jgi:hypothetical protein